MIIVKIFKWLHSIIGYFMLFALVFGTEKGLYITVFGYIGYKVVTRQIIPNEWLQDAGIHHDDIIAQKEKEFKNANR